MSPNIREIFGEEDMKNYVLAMNKRARALGLPIISPERAISGLLQNIQVINRVLLTLRSVRNGAISPQEIASLAELQIPDTYQVLHRSRLSLMDSLVEYNAFIQDGQAGASFMTLDKLVDTFIVNPHIDSNWYIEHFLSRMAEYVEKLHTPGVKKAYEDYLSILKYYLQNKLEEYKRYLQFTSEFSPDN